MWFPRRRHDEATPGPAPDVVRPSETAVRRDWAHLPALQRIGTGIDGVVDTGFDTDLRSWHSPGVLRPLDHALSRDAPSGMVLDSIARSALPNADASPNPSRTAVQRTVTFEPPRRPTATFTPEAPRSIPTVTFDGPEPAPAPLIAADPVPAADPAPAAALPWSAAETAPPPADDDGRPSEIATIEPLAPSPVDEPDAVAPTLGEPAPRAETHPAAPKPDPIQRTSGPSPRPFGLGPPLPTPGAEAVRGAPAMPVHRTSADPPPPVTAPVVQRERVEDQATADVIGSPSDPPESPPTPGTDADVAAPAPESATAPLLGETAAGTVFDPEQPDTVSGAAPAAPDALPATPEAPTAPLLGGQPPLLDVVDEEPEPPAGAGGAAGLSATPVVQTRRAGLGEPWSPTPEPAPVVQRTPAMAPSPTMFSADDASHDDTGHDHPAVETSAVASLAAPPPEPASADGPHPSADEPAAAMPPATAPLLPASAPISEPLSLLSAATPEAPAAPEAMVGLPLLGDRAAPVMGSTPGPSSAPGPSSGAGPAGAMPIQRHAASAPAGGPVPAPLEPGSASSASAPAPAETVFEVAPTLGTGAHDELPLALADEPSRPGLLGPPNRSDSAHPADSSGSSPADTGAPPSISVARMAASTPSAVALLGERSLGSTLAPRVERRLDGGPALQRLAAEPASMAPARAARTSATSSFAADGPGGAPGAAWSSQGTTSWVDAGSAAIEAGVAQRQADGSVVFATASSDGAAPEPDTGDGDGDGSIVQRAGAPSGPAAAAGAGRGAEGGDLDELAKRLYGRLRVMLKHELRLDRERAGMLTQGRR